jgi:hypothetical protein
MRFELVLAALGLFIPIAIFAGAVPSPAEAKPRPNIVMILSDDQGTQSYKFMPKRWALLGKRLHPARPVSAQYAQAHRAQY